MYIICINLAVLIIEYKWTIFDFQKEHNYDIILISFVFIIIA